ncbi:MAG: hypothetical protein KKA07_00270 [Bacteroidetes bacterium]|nr:hypothetical protein [Bacteroidota bacterium]MBU1717485.1 hypothetical protein [Bacteroidota bacterium]
MKKIAINCRDLTDIEQKILASVKFRVAEIMRNSLHYGLFSVMFFRGKLLATDKNDVHNLLVFVADTKEEGILALSQDADDFILAPLTQEGLLNYLFALIAVSVSPDLGKSGE